MALSALEPGTGAVNGKSSALLLLLLWHSECQQIVIREETSREQGGKGAGVQGWRTGQGWASGFDLKDVKVRNAAGTATAAEKWT